MSEYSYAIAAFKEQFDLSAVAERLGMTLRSKGHILYADCPTGHESKGGICFQLYPQLRAFRCYHCGITGDILHLVGLVQFHSQDSFHDSVHWLSDQFNVPLPWKDWTPQQQEEYKQFRNEQTQIRSILTDAADFYSHQMLPELIQLLEDHWGIHPPTIEKLKIGYASGEGLRDYLLEKNHSPKNIERTGLLVGRKEFFRKRLMFPLWDHGAVAFFSGRFLDAELGAPADGWTAQNEYEGHINGKGDFIPIKYKKMRIYGTDTDFLSPVLVNDSLLESFCASDEEVVITEGITDWIAAHQAGIPCLCPATVSFRAEDLDRVYAKVKRFKRIYLCNDNEANKAGEGGAIRTAAALCDRGHTGTFLITLPLAAGQKKIDLCEWLRDMARSCNAQSDLFSSTPQQILELITVKESR